MVNIIYLDEATDQIKSSNDNDFDELFIDLDNTYFFENKLPIIEQPTSISEIIALDHIFLSLKKHMITCTCNHPTFRLCFLENDFNH